MFLFFLPTLFDVVTTTPYACPTNFSLNRTESKNDMYVFPDMWNYTSGEAPEYNTEMQCLWEFYIPPGSFAQLSILADTPSKASVTLINCVGSREMVPSTVSLEPYFFVNPHFSIVLTVMQNVTGTFGFTVTWKDLPSIEPRYYDLAGPMVFTNINTIVVTSNSRVSLIASSASDQALNSYLRMFAIYDGCNTNATYLASLKQVASSRNQLISSGKSLTIVNLVPGSVFGNYFVVQNFENVKHFNQYKLADCGDQASCSIGLDARDGLAGLVSVSLEDRYIDNIEVPSVTSSLQVYYGPNYTGQIQNIPQKFNNYITTITLNQESALLEYTTKKLAGWQKSFDKRKGFFASKNYGTMSLNQDLDEILNGKQEYLYNIQIYSHGLVGNSTLIISTYDSSGRILSDTKYTSTSLPSINKMSYQCASFAVTYKTNGELTSGFNMNFEITLNSWATTSSNTVMLPWLLLIILIFR